MNKLRLTFVAVIIFFLQSSLFASDIDALQSETHNVSWAYFSVSASDGSTKWYISSLNSGNTYFLAPFKNGDAGWGIIGGSTSTSIATINLDLHRVTVKSGITFSSSSSGYYDAVSNNQYYSDSQHPAQDYAKLIDGKVIDIKWYFFRVAENNAWYIAKPSTSNTDLVYRFAANSDYTNYDWRKIGSFGRTYTKLSDKSYTIGLISGSTGSSDSLPTINTAPETATLPEISGWVSKFTSDSRLTYKLPTLMEEVCTFQDLQNVDWAKSSIDSLCSACILIGHARDSGTGRDYRPANNANLAEVFKVFIASSHYDSLKKCEGGHGNDDWYQCYFDEASTLGLRADRSRFNQTVTRGEAMVYIVNLFYKQSMSQSNALSYLVNRNIITYRSDGEYRLNDWLSRAELAVMAMRAATITGKEIPFGRCGIPKPPQGSGELLPNSSIPSVGYSGYGQKVFEKARSQLGKTEGFGLKWVDGSWTMCQRFTWAMHDGLYAKYGSAKDACNRFKSLGLLRTTGTPPAGAAVCYGPTPNNQYGHIAVATGNGTEIGIAKRSGVSEDTTPYPGLGNYYQGWVRAEDYKNRY